MADCILACIFRLTLSISKVDYFLHFDVLYILLEQSRIEPLINASINFNPT